MLLKVYPEDVFLSTWQYFAIVSFLTNYVSTLISAARHN